MTCSWINGALVNYRIIRIIIAFLFKGDAPSIGLSEGYIKVLRTHTSTLFVENLFLFWRKKFSEVSRYPQKRMALDVAWITIGDGGD